MMKVTRGAGSQVKVMRGVGITGEGHMRGAGVNDEGHKGSRVTGEGHEGSGDHR